MKKKLLLALMFIFTLGTVKAQSYDFISYGVKAGVNLSSVSGLSSLESAVEAGFTGGLSIEVRPFELVGISADVLYCKDGFKSNDLQVENWTATYSADLGYIDIPIMAKVYVWNGLSVNVGFMPSLLASSKFEFSLNGVSMDESPIQASSAAFSIPVGVSWKFMNMFSVEARYNIPVSQLSSHVETYYGSTTVDASDYNLKRQAFSFLVGITF